MIDDLYGRNWVEWVVVRGFAFQSQKNGLGKYIDSSLPEGLSRSIACAASLGHPISSRSLLEDDDETSFLQPRMPRYTISSAGFLEVAHSLIQK